MECAKGRYSIEDILDLPTPLSDNSVRVVGMSNICYFDVIKLDEEEANG